MKTIKLFLVTTILLPIAILAQTKEKKTNKLRISNVYVLPAVNYENNHRTDVNTFKKLHPNSILLNNDFTGYKTYNQYPASNFYLSTCVGITKFDENKNDFNSNGEMRLGFSYGNSNLLYANLNNTYINPIDTTQMANGQIIYYDSVTRKDYQMNINSEQLRLDFSFVFRTNPRAKFNLYAGLGFEFGGSINATSTILYTESKGTETSWIENAVEYGGQYMATSNTYTETYYLKDQYGVSCYLPMGFDLRIGEKNDFFKKIHLFGELRPGINTIGIPELKKEFVKAGIKAGLGLRVNF